MSKKLELPQTITALIKAQNEYDSNAYAALFSDNAIVHDEGKKYLGVSGIKQWNEETNKKYHIKLSPTNFVNNKKEFVLTVMVTGNFDGSPTALKYNFTFEDEKIKTLSIGG